MTDHCEEQEMEAEALTAIFDDCLEIVSSEQPFQWAVSLWPEEHSDDSENHVGVKLIATIPLDYPESSLPELKIDILRGLTTEHQQKLLQMANEEAEANMGLPSIYAVCEKLREWLAENNVKGMDDVSMFAQMKRREKEAELQAQKQQQEYETQKKVEKLTEAEAEELAVRKRRAEGTPVNEQTFNAWKEKFELEMIEKDKLQKEMEASEGSGNKKKQKAAAEKALIDKSGRITGYLQFSGKAGTALNLEAIEAAAENAQRDEDEEEYDDDDDDNENVVDGVDEDLFDVDDDDLDDLDFDDDDDDDDDDEEEPEI